MMHLSRFTPLAAGALVLAGLFTPMTGVAPVHAAQTLVVNTTADTGPCPGATCSLRGAVNRANADGSGDTITFNIPSSDPDCYGTPVVCHIQVTTTELPPLTANNTTIDAYTQPGTSKNTLGIVSHATSIPGPVTPQFLGTNAQLVIQLEGNQGFYDSRVCASSTIGTGFDVRGHFNTIQGFAIVGFCLAGIHLDGVGSYGNKIQGNFIGVQTNGQDVILDEYGNYYGICADPGAGYCTGTLQLAASRQHAAGGDATTSASSRAPGATLTTNQLTYPNVVGGTQNWQLNIVSYNAEYGIYVNSTGGMVIAHNLVGTNRTGTASLENGTTGIYFNGASHITVGGPNPQSRNIISGNYAEGVEEDYSDHIVIAANFIGTAVTGTSQLGNNNEGVYLYYGAHNTVGLSPLGTQLMGGGRNLISGNVDDGVYAQGEDSSVIQYNWIGVDITGSAVQRNYGDGIDLYQNNYMQTKGLSMGIPGHGIKILNNVISGNFERESSNFDDGIYDHYDFYDVIKGNRIGTNYRGAVALGNAADGIKLDHTTYTQVGGTHAGEGNVISGNVDYNGLELVFAAATTVQGNKIGTDLYGQKCIANGADYPYSDDGIGVILSAATVIGGSSPAAANVIACNGEYGIYSSRSHVDSGLPPSQQFSLLIQGNYIGTNGPGTIAAGTLHLSNKADGIVSSSDTGTEILHNVIAYNNANGIAVAQTNGLATAKISRNSIYRNGNLGIDLDWNYQIDCTGGTTSNPATTCPVITGATTSTVSGTADPGATVEVFVADNDQNNTDISHSPKLYGEGQTFLASIVAGPGGNWTVSIPSGALSSGQFVTATETVPASTTSSGYAETSEFSKNVKVS